ncbi:ABC transporter permease [Bacillus sp. Marseille-Q3570]|uniref:ABC transporter permease n=1 Tax=Bacillus sp. Marseille-Q3570 TaxID=2963522 RepID=UPI0021B824E5|nr:ABC transporter permease [Bacillus sp. Marseille-Q3570]
MQSQTSWINKEMWIQSFRSVGWIALIYLFGLFLALPMQILMIWSSEDSSSQFNYYDGLFSFNGEIQLLLVFSVPILFAIFLFRYLHVKNASDFMHSLPIKRSTLYNNYALLGVIYLLLPVLITGIVLMIMNGTMNLENFYTMRDVWVWMCLLFVITVLLFIAGIFIGSMTGLSAVQGVLTYILLLLPVGITILIVMNMTYFLYGFSANYYMSSQLNKYSPITALATYMIDQEKEIFTWAEVVLYLAMTLVLYIGGMKLYERRNLEGVSQAFVFQPLKPFFKYSVTLCVMLLGGMYFSETQHSFTWLLVGYILGSIFGYLIAEMLLQKTWRVFANLKGYIIFAVIVAVAIIAFRFDLTGYENRVPELNEVDQVFIGNGAWNFEHKDELDSLDGPEYYNPTLDSKENIQSVISLHEYLIDNKKSYLPSYHNTQTFFIAYEMKNGGEMIREYRVPVTEDLMTYLKPVYEANEYKEKTNRIFHISSEEVTRITVESKKGEAIVHEPEKIEAAIEALKLDVKEAPYDGGRDQNAFEPSIRIHLSSGEHNEVYLEFESSFERFEEWMKAESLSNRVLTTIEDIEYAVIAPSVNIEFNGQEMGVAEQLTQLSEAWKITKKSEIQDSIKASTWGNPDNKYFIVFKYKDTDQMELLSFPDHNIPDFVKEHFE